MKYDNRFKLDCVLKYKEGRRDFVPAGISRRSFLTHVRSWVKAFDDPDIDGLKRSLNNKEWTTEERLALVQRCLREIPLRTQQRKPTSIPGSFINGWKDIEKKALKPSKKKPNAA